MSIDLYRYKGCGLDNVFLRNGYSVRKMKSGEEVVAIEDIEGLHRAIALNLVETASGLDGKSFKFLRKELDMSQRQVGQMLDKDEQTVSLWERSGGPVPQAADIVLRTLTKETLSGHAELKKMIERFNSLDREVREMEARVEFLKEDADGWIRKCA